MDTRAIDQAYRRDRRRLVERMRSAGIEDLAVLHALDTVPRHLFVPEAIRHRAYEDTPLPLGHDQTISRPGVQVLTLTLAELKGSERVLEIGTGSGFLTALLSLLVQQVYSVEAIPALAADARRRLQSLRVDNAVLRVGDGSLGWPEHAPYDVILAGAAAPRVPRPWLDELADGGRLIMPVGGPSAQRLVRITRSGERISEETVDEARFVPLLGEEGW